MTPAQWVAERATEWAEWVERIQSGGLGHRPRSALAESLGSGDSYGSSDFVHFDHARCADFDAAVAGLVDSLRVVFRMHWLGSEIMQISSAAPVDEKAGRGCGLSRRSYYRKLEEANELLYNRLR